MRGDVEGAVTLGAAGIKGSLSQLGMPWDAGGEWSRERGVRLGATVPGSKEARLKEAHDNRG